MLDIKWMRENRDAMQKAIKDKGVNLNLNELFEIDSSVLELKKKVQELLEEKNAHAKKVASAAKDERSQLIEQGREIGSKVDQLKPKLQELEDSLQNLMWLVPNIPDPQAPLGKSEADNVEIKRWKEPPKFSFKPLDHVQILQNQNWADLERIANVSGSRTYSLKNEMVTLEMALFQMAFDLLQSKGFTLLTVPALVREHALYGTGHFPTGRDQVYYLPNDDLYLSGTAEVPLNSLHAKEMINEADLPILYAGFSPCFRREAGSAGRDVRGLIRVHQFYKVEQYIICKNDPEESLKWHQKLLETSEEIVQALDLPYRIVDCCTGDMGTGKVRMYDVECWVPSEEKYRETHSCSSLHDWQARRTNVRYREKQGAVKFCHTLNNTAVATPRILVPFLENHQLEDGRIAIPEKLRPYIGGKETLGKKLT
ncbi:MAG: serine--tRNA ligase [Parachlamydiales bacterium]|nr:serine--tRNA ligase [Parachlamydiales bacterium]